MKNATWSRRLRPFSSSPSASSSAAALNSLLDSVCQPESVGWLKAFAFGYFATASSRSWGSVFPRTTSPFVVGAAE